MCFSIYSIAICYCSTGVGHSCYAPLRRLYENWPKVACQQKPRFTITDFLYQHFFSNGRISETKQDFLDPLGHFGPNWATPVQNMPLGPFSTMQKRNDSGKPNWSFLGMFCDLFHLSLFWLFQSFSLRPPEKRIYWLLEVKERDKNIIRS